MSSAPAEMVETATSKQQQTTAENLWDLILKMMTENFSRCRGVRQAALSA
jgi:hypothetical protein